MERNDRMIFSKKIIKVCAYCEKAITMQDKSYMLCKKHGVIESGSHCGSFSYDPLKRMPNSKKTVIGQFTKDDFKID